MGESEAASVVQDLTGMWWPAGDSAKLRALAAAWNDMAGTLDKVAAATSAAAQHVIGGNSGKAIDAFRRFWEQYDSGGKKGALPDSAQACRQMAAACKQFADAIDKATTQLEEEVTVVGASLVAGTALAIFTAGISEAAAGAATAAIIGLADSLGVALSETVASIAATTLTGVAFGAVESTAVDALVAQPVRMSFGDGGWNWGELGKSALTGGVTGGALGGGGAAVRAVADAAESGSAAATALNSVSKISSALDNVPGRMLTGAALSAGQDEVFNGGRITGIDLVAGAIGSAAAPRGTAEEPRADGTAPPTALSVPTRLDEIRADLFNRTREGLLPPRALDQVLLENAVPRTPDGGFEKFADPKAPWFQLQNDGGNLMPGRGNNCADCTRSFLETWYGTPRVSAARTPDPLPDGRIDAWGAEYNSSENQMHWAGGEYRYSGAGMDGYAKIHQDLINAGHGSAAVIAVKWPGMDTGHAFAAVNYRGQVHWVDPQSGEVGAGMPIHRVAEHVWHIPLDSHRAPIPPAGPTPQER